MVPTCAGWAVRGRRRSGGAEGPPGIVRTFRPRASGNWSRDLGRNLGRNLGRTEAGGGAAARGARATRPESLVRMRWGAGYAICRHMGAWGHRSLPHGHLALALGIQRDVRWPEL